MTEDPLKGMTVGKFRTTLDYYVMTKMARALAPAVNSWAADLDANLKAEQMTGKERGRERGNWCPGCGEKAFLKPDLCEECLSLNAE